MKQCVKGGQRKARENWFSLSRIWVPGTEFALLSHIFLCVCLTFVPYFMAFVTETDADWKGLHWGANSEDVSYIDVCVS